MRDDTARGVGDDAARGVEGAAGDAIVACGDESVREVGLGEKVLVREQ